MDDVDHHGGLRSIRSIGRSIDWFDRFDRFDIRKSNVRLRLELPPDHAETSAKHVSDDLPKMIFSKKNRSIFFFRKLFGRKFLVFRNFRWILEDLGGF